MRKPNFLPRQVKDHLRSRFMHVDTFEALTEGEESQAFSFRGDGEELVVRINKSRAGFDKDRYAHRHFASDSLPVPEVRTIEPLGETWICVSVRARRQTLQALAKEAGSYTHAVAGPDHCQGYQRSCYSGLRPADERSAALMRSCHPAPSS